jgi:membrane protease YdiL (CAAX protease family)
MPLREIAALAAPPLVVGSTYVVFHSARFLAKHVPLWAAFSLPYGLYLVVWCWLFSFLVLGLADIQDLFQPGDIRFAPFWVSATLLLLPVLFIVWQVLPQLRGRLPVGGVLLVGIFAATINAPSEELLWRGVYTRAFHHDWLWGLIYPTTGFAVWNFAPIIPRPAATPGFKIFIALAGLMWGYFAQMSESILLTSVSHWAVDVMANAAVIQKMGTDPVWRRP